MVNVQQTRHKELTIQRRWMKGHGKNKSRKLKPNKTHSKQVTVFSACWLCQSLLILGHTALNLNILPKSKLINQQNTGSDAHYFSHIKQLGERTKKHHRNKTKVSTLTAGFLCEKCSQQLGSVFFCVKKSFLVCHCCLPLPQNTS